MKHLRKRAGFTLIELLVVILILAILMAIALPLYLRAVRDSNRQTCRSNMQTIANAEQAYRVRSAGHQYTDDLTLLVASDQDLQAIPQCPTDSVPGDNNDYLAVEDGTTFVLTISCNSNNATELTFHNTDLNGVLGFQVGQDAD